MTFVLSFPDMTARRIMPCLFRAHIVEEGAADIYFIISHALIE